MYNHSDLLGKKAKCKITRFEGVIKGVCEFRTAAPRVCIQGSKLHDQKPTERQWFDLVELDVTKTEVVKPVPCEPHDFNFGDRVQIETTGIEGIIDSTIYWATGCQYLGVQPSRHDPRWCEDRVLRCSPHRSQASGARCAARSRRGRGRGGDRDHSGTSVEARRPARFPSGRGTSLSMSPEVPTVCYAVTVWGHDGIPDGDWHYTWFFPLNPFEESGFSPWDFSETPREEVICRAYEKLLGKDDTRRVVLPIVQSRESGANDHLLCRDRIRFRCPTTDIRYDRHHWFDNVDYRVEFVLTFEEFDYAADGEPRFFTLTPFQPRPGHD